MFDNDILILKADEILSLLEGQELEIIRTVRLAYEAHAGGDSSLPHSTFLNFPADQRNRIIALPAYLGDEFGVAGIKWVSSFPGNLERGLDRASAVVILNSSETGRPEAVIEGSVISAKRTAASAALAAQRLTTGNHVERMGLLGGGLINFEIARFVLAACPEVKVLTVFDLDPNRAKHFARKCRQAFGHVKLEIAEDVETLFGNNSLISIATTAARPHLFDLSACAPGSTILHISLRDLSPELILASDNIVDDVSHVCRAQTSLHLAEQQTGQRDFIRCTLADILKERAPARRDDRSIAVFSPFGLGVLDIALGKLVCEMARSQSRGSLINSFLPGSWSEEETAKPAHGV